MNTVDHLDHVRPWLSLDIEEDGRLAVSPGCQTSVLGGDDSLSNVR